MVFTGVTKFKVKLLKVDSSLIILIQKGEVGERLTHRENTI